MKKLIKITERFTFLANFFTFCSNKKSVDAEEPAIIPEADNDREIEVMPVPRRERRKAVIVFRNGS